MALALALGRRGQGRVWPNPSVGAVIVKDGRILGRGRTADGGRPHAEVVALTQAGAAAKGATAYVTLEPCAHHGQTPPCAEALTKAGLARVVVATGDPDPRVNGQGLALLKSAGIEVATGVLEAEAQRDLQGFLSRVTRGRPSLTLKLASSLDGRIATRTGDSQWITGPEARRQVHVMRSTHDAVLVGAGTARADDPTLTVRGLGVTHQSVRVVLSNALDLPASGNLAQTAKDSPVWILHGRDAPSDRVTAWQAAGAQCFEVAATDGRIDLAAALQTLGDNGLTRVLCEGGGELAASLLKRDLVDDLVVFSAGAVLGGEGLSSVAALGIDALSDAPRFTLEASTTVGADVMHRWTRQQKP